MAAKIYLRVVEEGELNGAAVLVCKVLPQFKGGNPDESLACGSCKAVIAKDYGTADAYEQFKVRTPIAFKCLCGALNLVPRQPIA